VNRAWVDTADDPVCTGEECLPPPCAQAQGNNNVDCESTPVDRVGAVQIVKTDDVAATETVEPGDVYGYRLEVTNTGVSTILPGLVVNDDLPSALSLVSVTGGAGWSCNAVDPIQCTYAPVLLPGVSAPTIVVRVRVVAAAVGTSIVNRAVVVGAIDRNCPTGTTGTTGSTAGATAFVAACNQVTDEDDETTPLRADADLAIVKAASVVQAGAGGVFDWTLAITNNGPGTATNVRIGDLVPRSVTVTGVSSTDFACSRTGNDVTCTRATMAAGQSGTVRIAVAVPANTPTGTVSNVGTVQSDTPDPDLTNNSDGASVDLVAQSPPTTQPLPPVTLPRTGTDTTGGLVRSALLLILLGGVIVVATRRRRPTS
jgi:uncharacterized repeat protein (TIGR01451 family)